MVVLNTAAAQSAATPEPTSPSGGVSRNLMDLIVANPEQARQRDLVSWAEWGKGLEPDEWVLREDRLRAHRWPAKALRSWLLVDQDTVLSSCETYAMDTWWNGQRGVSWGIASVLTAPALRGKGYASALLERVHDRLAPTPGAQALMLYSDVGTAFYERLGYQACPSRNVVWPAEPFEAPTEPSPLKTTKPGGFITPTTYGEARPPRWGTFGSQPGGDQLDWHRARLVRPSTTFSGAFLGPGAIEWVPDADQRRLLVTTLRAPDPSTALTLVRAAQTHAFHQGLDSAFAFITPLTASLDGTITERASCIPMIRPLVPGLAAKDWLDVERAMWV